MYAHILNRLLEFNQIDKPELYLQNLQSTVKKLRQSYCNNQVTVNYSDPSIQAAYLLAYYPQYTEMTHEVFCNLNYNCNYSLFAHRGLQACFFGAGPAPETIGWLRYLNSNHPTARYAVAHTYDIAAQTWSKSQEITKYVASQLFPKLQLTLNGNSLNLCQKNAFSSIRDVIQTSRLFFMQNCLNEFVANSDAFIQNVDFLITQIPDNSVLIIADLWNYNSVIKLMEKLEASISNSSKSKIIRSSEEGGVCLTSSLTLPQVITKNLLTYADGLIPRKYINFNYLAIQKTPRTVKPIFADIPF